MPTPTKNTDPLQDPDFHRDFRLLDPLEQYKVLHVAIPEYKDLSSEDQEHVLNAVLDTGVSVTAPPPPNAIDQRIANGPDYRDPLTAIQHFWTGPGVDGDDLVNTAGKRTKEVLQGVKSTAQDYAQHPLKTLALPITIPANLIGGIGTMVKNAAGEVNNPDLTPGQKALGSSFALLGGDPAKAREERAEGKDAEADWDEFVGPLLSVGAAEAGAKAMSMFGGPVGRQEINSLGKMIWTPSMEGMPDEVAMTIQPYYKQAAKELGFTNKSTLNNPFTGQMPTIQSRLGDRNPHDTTAVLQAGNPSRTTAGIHGKIKALGKTRASSEIAKDIADRAVDITARPVETVLQSVGTIPIDPKLKTSIINELKTRQANYRKFGQKTSANAIDHQIESVNKAKTYNDLNKLKQDANKIIEGMFDGSSKSKQMAMSVEPIWTYRELGNTIRQQMYPQLQQIAHTNFDLGKMGREEAAAMDARDGIYSNYAQMGGEQVDDRARHYLERVGHGSLYKTHILRKIYTAGMSSPAGDFNKFFRRGLGEIPEDLTPATTTATATPSTISTTPPSTTFPGQPLRLPAQAGPSTTINPFTGTPNPPPNPFTGTITGPQAVQQAQNVTDAAIAELQRRRNAVSGVQPTEPPTSEPVVQPVPQNQPHYIGAQQPPASPFAFDVPTSTGGPEVDPRKMLYQGAKMEPTIVSGPKKKGRYTPPAPPVQGQSGAVTPTPEGYMTPSRTHYLTSTAEPVFETLPGDIGTWRTPDFEKADASLKSLQDFIKTDEFKKASVNQKYRIKQQIKQLQGQINQYKAGQKTKGPPSGATYNPAKVNQVSPGQIHVTHTPQNPGTPKGKPTGIVRRAITYGTLVPPPAQHGTPKATTLDEQREEREANPDTHHFSKSAWLKINPGGDVEAAAQAAQARGFDIID